MLSTQTDQIRKGVSASHNISKRRSSSSRCVWRILPVAVHRWVRSPVVDPTMVCSRKVHILGFGFRSSSLYHTLGSLDFSLYRRLVQLNMTRAITKRTTRIKPMSKPKPKPKQLTNHQRKSDGKSRLHNKSTKIKQKHKCFM